MAARRAASPADRTTTDADGAMALDDEHLAAGPVPAPATGGTDPPTAAQAAPAQKVRRVYSVQFSHSALPGRRRPGEFTREAFGLLLMDVHTAAFRERVTDNVRPNIVTKVMVFKERHANNEIHILAAIVCERPYKTSDIMARLRAVNVYASIGQDNVFFWPIVVYMGVPTVHKSEAEIDKAPWHSEGRTLREELADIPRCARPADRARVRAYLGLAPAGASTAKGLGIDEFAEMVRSSGWRTREAVVTAARAALVSTPALYETVLRMGCRKLDEQLDWIWELEGSSDDPDIDRLAKLLSTADTASCSCGGCWAAAAERLLQIQGIDSWKYRVVIVGALRWGRCKWVNPLIVGEPDAGKSFLVRPLAKIFKTFIRRGQNETFPMQGLHRTEVCVLQDVRYESFGLPWDDWLTWGEGEDIMVRLPRSHFAEGKMYTGKAPLFATMADLFSYPMSEARQTGRSIERENYQFKERWAIVPFRHPIPEEERNPTLVPCEKCSAQWYGAVADAVRAAGPPQRVTESWLRAPTNVSRAPPVPLDTLPAPRPDAPALPVPDVASSSTSPAGGAPAGDASSAAGGVPRPPDHIEQLQNLIDMYGRGLLSNDEFWQLRRLRGLM
jgi:hypothetical protein